MLNIMLIKTEEEKLEEANKITHLHKKWKIKIRIFFLFFSVCMCVCDLCAHVCFKAVPVCGCACGGQKTALVPQELPTSSFPFFLRQNLFLEWTTLSKQAGWLVSPRIHLPITGSTNAHQTRVLQQIFYQLNYLSSPGLEFFDIVISHCFKTLIILTEMFI